MDNVNARADEQTAAPETPEDVAILYSWANLPGAKYRDFSASRREYRAQQRARVAETQRQAELQAARELEEAAQREIEAAQRQVEATRQAEAKAAADAAQAVADAEAKRRAEELLRIAERNAERERQEAFRRQQAAEELRIRAERAQEEMLEARKRAEEQAARYAEAEAQSADQGREQARGLPGETSDPYYYTGPVDPAYFASTPGVRTAQATRVSTERKAYVYPVHPGSDEFDAGTIVSLRAPNPFAPSPAPLVEQPEPQRADTRERTPVRDAERKQTLQSSDADAGYLLDDDYYDGGHMARMFRPSPRTRFAEGRETAAADLHIRPASRVSSEREVSSRAVRPSPLAQVSSGSSPAFLKTPDAALAGTSSEAAAHRPARTDGQGSSNDYLLQESSEAGEVAAFAGARFKEQETIEPVAFAESRGGSDESQDSRMFIPGPRRRMGTLEMSMAGLNQADQPVREEAERRDAAASEGAELSRAETERREAQDHFVHQQETGSVEPEKEVAAAMLPTPTVASSAARHEEPAVQWRAVNRMGESGFRRRRQPAREPVARTARQPRLSQDPDPMIDPSPTGEPSAPPAWLSAERPAKQRQEPAKTEAPLPAAPGDPDLPLPRTVPRRQPSGLRPRVQAPAPSVPSSVVLPGISPSAKVHPEPVSTTVVPPAAVPQGTANDTLQQSRERVASRWFALSGLMGTEGRPAPDARVRTAPHPAPMLCVLSISGGVGKTSIVATLGRALSSLGEKVMLADTSIHGILPYYFGAREQRPGAVRTFSPPPGSSDAPVVLVNYDADGRGYDEAGQTRVLDDLYRRSAEVQRVLVDAGVNSAWLARTVAGTNPWVLVPVAPDMNSVLSTQAVERLFQDVTNAEGRPVQPFYVLNQYDASVPLHLDVREVLRQFLGERLLPIMLHRTPTVSEALAEGMTVIDYAPRAPITNDYMNLATWVRNLADPGLSYARPARWSER